MQKRMTGRGAAWMLAVAAALAACDGNTGPENRPPAAVSPVSPVQQTATAGDSARGPEVIVEDARERPVAGVTVAFAVTAGGGSVQNATAVTGADGIARAGRWTLGTGAGANTVTATVQGLAPVVFTASGAAGAPATVAIVAGNGQSARGGRAVAVAPSVRVTDAHGNRVAGATVTFAVASGQGAVTGATATTDSAGLAAAGGWTLGAPGANTLRASVGSLPAATFTATAIDPCTLPESYTLGSGPVAGVLETWDCRDANRPTDLFRFTLANTDGLSIQMRGGSGGGALLLNDSQGRRVVTQGYGDQLWVIAPAGTYTLGATREGWNAATPPYDYTVAAATTEPGGRACDNVPWIVPGVTFTLAIEDNDYCYAGSAPPSDFYHTFRLGLTAGQQVTIEMTSTELDPFIFLSWGIGGYAYSDDIEEEVNLNARLAFTAPVTGEYTLNLHAADTPPKYGTDFGRYTLTVR